MGRDKRTWVGLKEDGRGLTLREMAGLKETKD